MELSAKFQKYFQKKSLAHLLGYLTIILLVLVLADETESGRVGPVRIGKQEDADSTDDTDNQPGRIIKAKRQNYNLAGLSGDRFPFQIAISELFTASGKKRRKLTQEEHIKFNVSQKIKALGYYGEEHTVETEDGYLLTLFRMQKKNCNLNRRAPILFMHGVVDSADTWFVLDVDDGAPYQAANKGYDVWIGNARGNHYANKHKTLSTKDPKFWKFSWHEIGTKDLPAIFQYILDHTSETTNPRQRISYVGHSMGTTSFFVCMSVLPQWNKKVDLFVALPPSAFLTGTTSPLVNLKPYTKLYNSVLTDGPFLMSEITDLISKTLGALCPVNITIGQFQDESLCNFLVYFGQGNSKEDTNSTILERVFGHFPSTTSKRLIAHFVQLLGEDRFTYFDYGDPVENFKRYNQTYPPSYNLYNVDVASVNYYGQRDILIDHTDSEKNLQQLGTTRSKFYVLVMDYSHLDFVWGNSAATAVSARFLAAMEAFYASPPPAPKSALPQAKKETKLNGVRSCACSCDGDHCFEDFDDEDDANEKLFKAAFGDYTFAK